MANYPLAKFRFKLEVDGLGTGGFSEVSSFDTFQPIEYSAGDREAASWKVINAWPIKYTVSDFNAASNEIAVETLELAHEGISRVF